MILWKTPGALPRLFCHPTTHERLPESSENRMHYVRALLAIESDDQARPLSSVVGLADIHHHWSKYCQPLLLSQRQSRIRSFDARRGLRPPDPPVVQIKYDYQAHPYVHLTSGRARPAPSDAVVGSEATLRSKWVSRNAPQEQWWRCPAAVYVGDLAYQHMSMLQKVRPVSSALSVCEEHVAPC